MLVSFLLGDCLCFYVLGKGGYVFGGVGLCVCSFVSLFMDNKSYQPTGMKC